MRKAPRERSSLTPTLLVLDGDNMNADDAAWAMLADTAAQALTLPGLSPDAHRLLSEALDSCRYAAGLPPRQSHQEASG